MSFYNKIP